MGCGYPNKQISGEPVSIHEIPFLARVRREARMVSKSHLALFWILYIYAVDTLSGQKY